MNPIKTTWFKLPNGVAATAVFLLLVLFGCDNSPVDAGVVTTGNAGRISGIVISNGHGVAVTARLFRVLTNRDSLADSSHTDSTGAFAFATVPPGKYRVEAWLDGKLNGKSGEFQLVTEKSDIVIVLVRPVEMQLDLSSLGTVDSVFLDHPGNPATFDGKFWTVHAIKDSTSIVYTRLVNPYGPPTWMSWNLTGDGQLRLRALVDKDLVSKARPADTALYTVNAHTTALWTFDEVTTSGTIADHSKYHNDLTVAEGQPLLPSPHGKAIALQDLPDGDYAYVDGDSLAPSLQWWSTGMQTIRLRVKLSTAVPGGFVLFGTYVGFNIGVTPNRQILIGTQGLINGEGHWYQLFSASDVMPVGKWVDLTISMFEKTGEFYLWMDGTPKELYSTVELERPTFRRYPYDELGLGGGWWDTRHGPYLFDEIRISDTLDFGVGLKTLPSFKESVGGNGDGVNVYSFADSSAENSLPQIDRADTVKVGKGRNLFFKPLAMDKVIGQTIVHAQLFCYPAIADAADMNFSVHRAYASFETKIANNQAPVPGLDYDSIPMHYSPIAAGYKGGLKFDFIQLALDWSVNPSSNYGVVVKAATPDQSARDFILHSKIHPPTLDIYYH